MKLIVKTLKGGKFEVEADGGQTIAQLKGVIVSTGMDGRTGPRNGRLLTHTIALSAKRRSLPRKS
jgi:hypothetical protein